MGNCFLCGHPVLGHVTNRPVPRQVIWLEQRDRPARHPDDHYYTVRRLTNLRFPLVGDELTGVEVGAMVANGHLIEISGNYD